MSWNSSFNGFPKETLKFYADIAENNSKPWFEQHRRDFDDFVMRPARAFVVEMGERLRKISPKINADPRVNKSLFKIHRDTRFSPDKTPFKTYLGIMFWEGERKRMECSCYYFHLNSTTLMVGSGIYMFPKPHLEEYRKSVIHPERGSALAEIIAILETDGFQLGGRAYKKTPRGFDPQHERAELLLHKGLYAGVEDSIPKALHSSELLDTCFDRFERMAPLHKWLVAMTGRIS
ncbi:MAG: DUF2461 domain-containing protein [bacterium]